MFFFTGYNKFMFPKLFFFQSFSPWLSIISLFSLYWNISEAIRILLISWMLNIIFSYIIFTLAIIFFSQLRMLVRHERNRCSFLPGDCWLQADWRLFHSQYKRLTLMNCLYDFFFKKIHQLQIKFKSWNLINEREDEQISLDSGEDVQEGGLSFPE